MELRKKGMTALLVVSVFLFASCGSRNAQESPYKIFGVNAQGTALTEGPFTGEMTSTEETIDQMLEALKAQENLEIQPAIPADVQVTAYHYENGKLDISFSLEYKKMDRVEEVLCRAAVVRTLTQINGVNQVMFFVEDMPLKNQDGEPYGYMQASDFVQNTGSTINSYEVKNFVIYYSDKSGKQLIEDEVSIRCSSNQARESIVIESLIKGPKCEDAIATIPKGTELLSSSIKNGVCYLNFNEGLNNSISGVTPEVIIYSIVNTVVECGNAGLVQIAINGDSNIMFQESVKLGEPLGRNLDIVEGQ